MTTTEAAYLAGLIDGEGTVQIVCIRKGSPWSPSYSVRVFVSNTNVRLMDWCHQRGASVRALTSRGTWPQRRPCFRATWTTRAAATVLAEVLPFLVVKQEQARCALDLSALNRAWKMKANGLSTDDIAAREALKVEINRLNKEKP
jgi:hypothetical protein